MSDGRGDARAATIDLLQRKELLLRSKRGAKKKIDAFKGMAYVCPVCGKDFVARDDWVFWVWKTRHIKRKLCSWKCLRKWEKEHGLLERERHYVPRQPKGGL